MATLVLRGVKGSPLTATEVDSNFTNINTEVATKVSTTAPAFTGNVSLTNGSALLLGLNSGLEVGSLSAVNTPFLDFHSSGNNIDYDSRISGVGGTSSSGQGTINYNALNHVFNNPITGSVSGTSSNITGIAAITNGGTGSTNATTARVNLGSAASGLNSDITALSALTTPLTVAQGGTGAVSNATSAFALKGANSDITSLGSLNSVPTVITAAISNKANAGANSDITSLTALTAINNTISVNTINTNNSLTINDTGSAGANIKLGGNGATTPNKYIRANNGYFQIINHAYTAVLMTVEDNGNLTVPGSINSSSQGTMLSSGQNGFGPGGLVEVGRYFDFHGGNAAATDFDVRFDATGNGTAAAGNLNIQAGGLFLNGNNINPIGVNQSWQDVTAGKAFQTGYTNNSGRPIFISVTVRLNINGTTRLVINGVAISTANAGNNLGQVAATFTGIVPNGQNYYVEAALSLVQWLEFK